MLKLLEKTYLVAIYFDQGFIMPAVFFFIPDPNRPRHYTVAPGIVVQTPLLRTRSPQQSRAMKAPYYRARGFFDLQSNQFVEFDVFIKDKDTQEYVRCPSKNEIWAQLNRLPYTGDDLVVHYGLDGNIQSLELLPV